MQMSSIASTHDTAGFDWRSRLRAAGIHLVLSCLVAALSALLVFLVWYPFPYRELSGGRDLFLLLVSVDVVIGPLITFAVFNRAKPARELRRDLLVVGLLQLAALGYGLWTVHMARPVHLVFEYDRFRVVHQLDIPAELVDKAPAGIDVAPWGGPTLIALRPFRNAGENQEMTLQALGGISLSARPELWVPYATQTQAVLQAARPIESLAARFPQRRAEIDAAVRATGRQVQQLRYLPLLARKEYAWTALLDGTTADIVGYLPLDSF
jgi:hypothetical protein